MDLYKKTIYLLCILFGVLAIILTLTNPTLGLISKIILTLFSLGVIYFLIIQFFDWNYILRRRGYLNSIRINYGPCTIKWINRTAQTINVVLGNGPAIILGLKTSPHRLIYLGRWTVYTDPNSDLEIYRDNQEPYERWYYLRPIK